MKKMTTLLAGLLLLWPAFTQTPGCTEAFEPNDTRAAAAIIQPNTGFSAALAKPGDVDFYKIHLPACGSLTVRLYNLPADYNMKLLITTGIELDSSNNTGSQDEIINRPFIIAGDYYIMVQSANGSSASQLCYRLETTFSAGEPALCSFANEPNDTFSTATVLPLNSGIQGAITSPTDKDVYVFTVPPNMDVTGYGLTMPLIGYKITIYNANGVPASPYSEPGTYYLVISAINGDYCATNCYTVFVRAVYRCNSLYDTPGNNTLAGASTVPKNSSITGKLGPGDVDYYRYILGNSYPYYYTEATLFELPANYNMDLLNASGIVIASSTNGMTVPETIFKKLTSGTYYIKIYGATEADYHDSCYRLEFFAEPHPMQERRTAQSPLISDRLTIPVKIYPNPAKNVLNIHTSDDSKAVLAQVTDATGRVIMRQELQPGTTGMATGTLAPGIYMIRIIGKDGLLITQHKMIKE